jgi:predicted outer membrane repeat protein
LRNLTIRGAGPAIGAFSQGGDPLTIENVAFEDNVASEGGGAIFSNVPVNISGSTFSGNAASTGSAVIAYAPVTVVNSTLTNNEYVEPPQDFRTTEDRSVLGGVASPDYFQGGVIVTLSFAGSEDPSDISLTNVTLAGNDPGLSASLATLCIGEGPCPEGPDFPSGDIEVDNSIIAEEGAGCGTPNSGLIFGGGNVVQNTTTGCDDLVGGPPAPTTQVTASSIALQPLALNAPGDTETMALGSSSVARGAAVGAKCPETDQRGVARPASSCDSGAYQTASSPPPSGKPKLKVTVKTPKKVKAGKKFTIRVKTTNRAKAQTTRSTASSSPGTTAKRVKTCVKLPRGVFVVNASGGKVSGRSVCWTRSSLAAGRSVNYSVVVRSSSSDSGNARITASVRGSNSSGAKAQASAKAKIDVIDPKPKPKPEPPTG